MIFWIVKIITFIPLSIFCPSKMVGKKNIPKGKVIIVCNHISNLDYVYLFTRIWRKQYILAKKELFKNRIIGWFFKACCGIPVDRENVKLDTIKKSLKVLSNNKMLTIFPEGTRNKTDKELLEFKGGPSIFAVRSNAPIVPMYITKRPHLFKINKIVVGEPIFFDNTYKGEDGIKRANEIIKEKMLELKNK